MKLIGRKTFTSNIFKVAAIETKIWRGILIPIAAQKVKTHIDKFRFYGGRG